MHTWNPSTWQAEAGALQALGQHGLCREILFRRKKGSGITAMYSTPSTNFYLYLYKDNLQINPCSEIERSGLQRVHLEAYDQAYSKLEGSKYSVQNKTVRELEMSGHVACLLSWVSGNNVLERMKSYDQGPEARNILKKQGE